MCVLAAFGAERLLDGDGRAVFLVGSRSRERCSWMLARNTTIETAATISPWSSGTVS
jgi:hypothetical protein